MPPHGLPDSAAVSGLKSDNTKGGGGYNEYIMDNTKGKGIRRQRPIWTNCSDAGAVTTDQLYEAIKEQEAATAAS